MSPIAVSLLHRFRAAFADLAELRDEEGRARINEAIAAHMRSTAPLAFAAPPCAPAALISRDLADGSRYQLAREADCVVVRWVDSDGAALGTLAPIEVVRLRADLDSVASGGTR